MYHPYPLYFLVLAFVLCSAYERGNVLKFGPDGDFKYLFSRHENDIETEENKLVHTWIQYNNRNLVQLFCNRFEINSKTENVMIHFRATLVTKGDIELESFKVNDCSQTTLLNGIVVSQQKDDELHKEYTVFFKDDKNVCRKRTYTIEITPNGENPLIAVTRSKASPVTGRGKCPIKTKIYLASEWYDDDTIHDYALYNDYSTTYRLGCDMCWVFCRKTKSGKNYVDLILGKAPVDRIQTTSCTKLVLKLSINFDVLVTEDDRSKSGYINFLKTDGTCYTRIYRFDVQDHENRMLERAFVKRNPVTLNEECKTMKAKGFARSIALTVKRHFGRLTNPWVKTDITEDAEAQEKE